jgi:hypothetical protein
MFQGFSIERPSYEIITPQTKQSFSVQSLTVMKEERLKGSLTTPVSVTEHLNTIIWESICKKPDNIKTFEDFLKQTTVKDRDALLYGLYHITYEEVRNYNVTCGSCGKDFQITVTASSTFDFNGYPGNDVLSAKVKVPLPKSPSVCAILRQPTLEDEIKSLKNLSAKIDLITITLPIEQFIQETTGKEPIVYKERGDILDAYLSLPPLDKREIHNQYYENFGKYCITLKCKSYCPKCGNEEVIDIDLVDQFFRMVYTIR